MLLHSWLKAFFKVENLKNIISPSSFLNCIYLFIYLCFFNHYHCGTCCCSFPTRNERTIISNKGKQRKEKKMQMPITFVCKQIPPIWWRHPQDTAVNGRKMSPLLGLLQSCRKGSTAVFLLMPYGMICISGYFPNLPFFSVCQMTIYLCRDSC